MEDSVLIWKFLEREYPNDHQVIYLYCCGNVRSPITAINQIMKLMVKIFSHPINETIVKTVVKGFLDNKKKEYIKGVFKVQPIY